MFANRCEALERPPGRILLSFFLAAAVRGGKPAAAMPDFDLEGLLVFRAGFAPYSILYRAEASLLKPFLQRGLVIGPLEAFDTSFESRQDESASQKISSGRKTGVEIDGSDDCFVRVGEQAHFFTPAGLFFARTETEMAAELQAARGSMDGRRTDQPRQTLRKLAGVPMGKGFEELFAGDQAEHAVAEKFETLVIDSIRVLAMRAVSEGALEPFGMREAMPEDCFEFSAILIGHDGMALSRYLASFLAASALCLQRSCSAPGIWPQRLKASAASE